MRVALVHDWLVQVRGGEKVLEALAELFPKATIHTLFYDRERLSPALQSRKIKASYLQKIPGIKKFYRWLLPLFPHAVQSLEIEDVDLVISSSHCVAKGVRIPPGAYHLCYCHTPMRYVWGYGKDYFDHFPPLVKSAVFKILKELRHWDFSSAQTVDQFVANSENVQHRIQRFYERPAEVTYPPLDLESFFSLGEPVTDHYLVVSAFVPYKRIDLAIRAFNQLDRNLWIVGEGPLENHYRRLCQSKKIRFLGSVGGEKLRQLYATARALVFPTEEDFGIVPLEAQACGTPVIALAKGGALESVYHGVFFKDQTAEALVEAVLEFENLSFDRKKVELAVAHFDKKNFQTQFLNLIRRCLESQPAHALP